MHIEYVYERISNSISGSIFECIFNSINSIKNAHGLCPFGLCPVLVVSAPSPRGRYGKFVVRQSKRRQIATFNQIRSARLNSGKLYRRALAAR